MHPASAPPHRLLYPAIDRDLITSNGHIMTTSTSSTQPMSASTSNAHHMNASASNTHPMTASTSNVHPMTASTSNFDPMTASNTDIHDMNDSLLKQLECPVCFETCLPPIFMCSNGHNICNSCRSQLQECSICREPGELTCRNRFAEDISAKVKLPCPNTIDGCTLKFNTKDLETHLHTCENQFKYTCVLDELTKDTSINDYCVVWHGSRENLIQHVKQKHPYSFSDQVCTDLQRLIGHSNYRHTDVKLISVFGQLFWIMMFSDRKNGVEVVPYYVGNHGNERKFECKMEVSSPDGEFRVTCCGPIYNWADGNKADGYRAHWNKAERNKADRNIMRLKEEMLLAFLNKDILTIRVTIVKK